MVYVHMKDGKKKLSTNPIETHLSAELLSLKRQHCKNQVEAKQIKPSLPNQVHIKGNEAQQLSLTLAMLAMLAKEIFLFEL